MKDKLAVVIGLICGMITLFAFSFLYIIIEIPPFLQILFVMLAFGTCFVISLVVWQILSGAVKGGVLGEIAIISGAAILGYLLIKSLFKRDTLIYRCPTCNLVVMNSASQCRRCGTILNWNGVIEK